MLVVFSSVAIGSSYLMSGFLGVETIEAITLHVDYFSLIFSVQKEDNTNYVLIIRAMKGDKVIAQASTSDPNSVAVISFTLSNQN